MALRRDRLAPGSARPGRYRLLAPVAVAAAIALGAWAPTVAAGSSPPSVAPRSVHEVLASALSARVPGLSGTVRWTADLGLPDLGGLVGTAGSGTGVGPTDFLSGSHTIEVWVAGSDRQRLAIPGSLSEVDLVHNGDRAWYYDSTTDTVTDYVTTPAARGPAPYPAAPAAPAGPDRPALTPDAIAARLLGHLAPTTSVTLGRPITVAHRASYVLDLAPTPGTAEAAASTVRQISLAVDAATGLVLHVRVDAKGQSSPALQVGFTSISYSVPGAGAFRPLTGGTVKTKTLRPGDPAAPGRGAERLLVPAGWGAVATFDHVDLGSATAPLWDATTVVTGPFGSGRLLHTSLLNVLFLPDGGAVAGFVTPTALEAAAAGAG